MLIDMTGNGALFRPSTWYHEWYILYDGPSRGKQSQISYLQPFANKGRITLDQSTVAKSP
jgi:hypothetical protein